MSTNIELSPGAGGAKLATYKDASGNSWTPAAVVYMTSTTDNAAVAQPVGVGHGMPVVQDGTWIINPGDTPNTVPWLTSISQGGNTAVVNGSGQLTVLATISGTVAVGAISSITSITNPVTVTQGTASNLLATVNIASGQTLGTVTNVGTVSTVTAVTGITNPVTVAQSTAANLKALVDLNSGQTLANVTTVGAVTSITNPVTVAQATAGNLNATVSIAAAQTLATVTNVTTVGTITNAVTVAQPTAGNLNATVSIAAAQTLASVTTIGTLSTITNPVTVAQATPGNLLATVNIASAQTLATVTTVGTVTNVTTVGTITNPVGVAAGTNLIGRVAASDETSTIYNGTTALTPKFAKVTATASGNTSLVALVAGKKIRVLRISFSSNGAVNVKFQSNTTDITPLWYLTQYASGGGGFCPVGLFETASGEALNINLSTTGNVGVLCTYCEV